MRIQIGERCYFSRIVTAAGVIPHYLGGDFILRHMEFKEGVLVAEKATGREFKTTIGFTTYTFHVSKQLRPRLRFLRKPPQKK